MKRNIIIALLLFIPLFTIGCNLLKKDEETGNEIFDKYKNLSHEELLTTVGKWEKVKDKNVVWEFNSDKTAKLTDSTGEYSWTWEVEDNKLIVTYKWNFGEDQYDMGFVLDGEEFKAPMLILNDKNGKQSKYVPVGTQEE